MAAGAILAPLIIPITDPLTRKSKNHIDTKTPISIQSDSAGVLIFFTLDGSKPVAGQRGSDGSSRKYTDPILLPAGQVTVRAMAVTRDGRESSVVTKGFSVDQVETGISDDSRDGLLYFSILPVYQDSRHQEQLSSTQWSQVQRDKDSPWYRHKDRVNPTVTDLSCPMGELLHHCLHHCLSSFKLSSTLFVVRCPRCLSARPPDPFARFCPQCGFVIPPVTAPKPSPAETGQMLQCASCQSLVPVNTQTCLICETSTDRSQQPLLSLQVRYTDTGPDGLRNTISCVSCWQCGASAHPGALFCTSCGVSALTQNDAAQKAMPPSISAPRLKVGPPSVYQATQTVGLYYPSSMALQKKEQQRAIQHTQELANRDRRPPLTAISPGRGYWRKQLDHVCAHLRSYTQNHSSFRTLLAEPRLGQMISAVIQEDQQEVILTLSFSCVAPEQHRTVVGSQVGLYGNIDGPVQGGSGIPSQAQTLSHVTEQSTVRTSLGKNHSLTRSLFIHQGADPSCCGSDSRHALAVAVVNSHYDVLPVLIQRGADVDQQSGPCKASVRKRNAAGQTAYDMAVTSGCDDMMSLLAAQTGLDLLGRSHQNLDII
uniref:Double zinc ribbon and ankyrin repeat domains 1 n=1 Tax=Cyprinodon variegatus TaxID=28743 RepID=A0A3Q2CLI7_CYPVA